MGRKLYQMTWLEVQAEMSIAGSPEKIAKLGDHLMTQIASEVDWTNRAEIINMELATHRILAEIKGMQRRYDKSH